MNYESISDWFDLVAEFLCWEGLHSLEVDSTSTAGDIVKAFAETGVDILQRMPPIHTISEAESLSYIWWSSQVLKKFNHGVAAKRDETYVAFKESNRIVTKSIPVRHLKRVRELLARALPNVDDSVVTGRFGPGAVAERFNPIQKWNSIEAWSYDPRTLNLCDNRGQGDLLPPCRLHCVPKDFAKYRLITVEPCENTFGQQWVRTLLMWSIYSGPLRGSAFDFVSNDDPGKIQRRRALASSKSAKLATLDLSCASDSISFDQIVQVFPAWLVSYLERFRTPRFIHPGCEDEFRMEIFAGMGNATTFLVESLYFWAVTTSISEWLGDKTLVTVYGDDIVCGNRAANHPLFEPELNKFGLRLNMTKSGMSVVPGFRESCGLVAHSGFELDKLIRIPGYNLGTVKGLVGAIDLTNRLAASPRWYHACLADTLYKQMASDGHLENVPNLHSFGFGSSALALSVPWFPESYDPDRVRYNRDLNVLELKTVTVKDKERKVRRVHLTQAEAWGVITQQLQTSPGRSKTVLKYATKRTNTKVKWVGAIAPAPVPYD